MQAQDFCGFTQPFGNFIVFDRGGKPAGGVVVGHGKSGRAVLNKVGENFPGVDYGAVHQAYGHHPHSQHLMRAVEGKADKALLLSVGVMPYQGKNLIRLLNSGT